MRVTVCSSLPKRIGVNEVTSPVLEASAPPELKVCSAKPATSARVWAVVAPA